MREAALAQLAGAQSLPADLASEKLWVTSTALRLRRDQPALFGPGASYEPIASASPHALGFVRGGTGRDGRHALARPARARRLARRTRPYSRTAPGATS